MSSTGEPNIVVIGQSPASGTAQTLANLPVVADLVTAEPLLGTAAFVVFSGSRADAVAAVQAAQHAGAREVVLVVDAADVDELRRWTAGSRSVRCSVAVVADHDGQGLDSAVAEARLRARLLRLPSSAAVVTSATADRQLRRFLETYDPHRAAIGEALIEVMASDPAIAALAHAQTPEQREAQDRQTAELQGAAILRGEWKPYLDTMRQQGAGYAALGLGFGAWHPLLSPFRRLVVKHWREDGGESVGDAIDVILGMDEFLDRAMAQIALGYLDASAKRRLVLDHRTRLAEAVIDGSYDAIVSETLAGTITGWNDAATSLFARDASETLGRTVSSYLPASEREFHQALVRRVANGEQLGEVELGFRRDDGVALDLVVRGSPVRSSDGEVVGVSWIYRDLSGRRAVEREREQLIERLRRSNEDLEHFAYVASHDLQEPLRMITGHLGLIELGVGDALDDDGRTSLTHAIEAAARMKRLIEDLLQYARIDSRGKPLEPCSVSEVVARAVQPLEPELASCGGVIDCETLPTVMGDASQLELLFRNLIGNAIKFRSPERPPRVEVRASERAGEWRFSVADNGIGFSEDAGERIFMMFQRLHDRAAYEGSGIGLAIARRVVQRHGGHITARPRDGGGAELIFTLATAS